jgi:ADP-ribose pyrophosphatase YjhB (NUDIX family)
MSGVYAFTRFVSDLRSNDQQGVRVWCFLESGELVLVRQSYTKGWHPPGGSIRVRESPQAASRRELQEEVGFIDGDGPYLVRRTNHNVGPESIYLTSLLYVRLDSLLRCHLKSKQ